MYMYMYYVYVATRPTRRLRCPARRYTYHTYAYTYTYTYAYHLREGHLKRRVGLVACDVRERHARDGVGGDANLDVICRHIPKRAQLSGKPGRVEVVERGYLCDGREAMCGLPHVSR